MTRAVVYDLTTETDGVALDVAVAALGRGEVVWTHVHGSGCLIADAFSMPGVAALLQARVRGRGAGLPVLVRDTTVVHALFEDVSLDAAALMTAHWPGPLTLLGVPTPSLTWDIGAAGRLAAVAVSMAPEGFAAELVARVGPCVYLQAHSDALVLETALQAHARMADAVSVYVQQGKPGATSAVGPTTIVDVRTTPATVVRAGAIPASVLRATCPGLVSPDSGLAQQ